MGSVNVLAVLDSIIEMHPEWEVSAEKVSEARAAVAELIAYAECEEAKRLSLLPTSKGGTGNGQSYLATFQRYGFDGRDVYGFLDKLRRAALARVGGAS